MSETGIVSNATALAIHFVGQYILYREPGSRGQAVHSLLEERLIGSDVGMRIALIGNVEQPLTAKGWWQIEVMGSHMSYGNTFLYELRITVRIGA